MYRLTIAANTGNNTSDHPDWTRAYRALIDYVVGADYYLRLIQTGRPHTSYDLLDLNQTSSPIAGRAGAPRAPRTVGQAAIAKLAGTDIDEPYYIAAAAQRWISDYQARSTSGSPGDAAIRYAATVLVNAQAEARCWFSAGALLREAAHLAGTEPIPDPHQPTLEALRDNATQRLRSQMCPAELAAAVQEILPADTPSAHVATYIWWFALLTWGAATP
jgi:hypothetical protein